MGFIQTAIALLLQSINLLTFLCLIESGLTFGGKSEWEKIPEQQDNFTPDFPHSKLKACVEFHARALTGRGGRCKEEEGGPLPVQTRRIKALYSLKPSCTFTIYLNHKKINLAIFIHLCVHYLTCLTGGELEPAVEGGGFWLVPLPPHTLLKQSDGGHTLHTGRLSQTHQPIWSSTSWFLNMWITVYGEGN